MAAQRIAGVCFFRVGATQMRLRANLKIQWLSTSKEGIAGLDSVHGFKETPMVPYIEAQITDLAQLSIKAFGQITDETITAELANGKVGLLRNAWYAGTPDTDAANGTIEMKFEGLSCEEILG